MRAPTIAIQCTIVVDGVHKCRPRRELSSDNLRSWFVYGATFCIRDERSCFAFTSCALPLLRIFSSATRHTAIWSICTSGPDSTQPRKGRRKSILQRRLFSVCSPNSNEWTCCTLALVAHATDGPQMRSAHFLSTLVEYSLDATKASIGLIITAVQLEPFYS